MGAKGRFGADSLATTTDEAGRAGDATVGLPTMSDTVGQASLYNAGTEAGGSTTAPFVSASGYDADRGAGGYSDGVDDGDDDGDDDAATLSTLSLLRDMDGGEDPSLHLPPFSGSDDDNRTLSPLSLSEAGNLPRVGAWPQCLGGGVTDRPLVGSGWCFFFFLETIFFLRFATALCQGEGRRA